MTAPLLYQISKGEATAENFETECTSIIDAVQAAVDGGVPYVQVREKNLSAMHVFEITEKAVAFTRGSGTRLLVNDRWDIALAAGADGVHLTSGSLSPGLVRRHTPAGFLIGVSTHSIEQIEAASDADLIVFGPVFDSPGKAAVGLDPLAAACRSTLLPVIAVGGINAENGASAIEAGAAGIAAIRALQKKDSIRELREALHDAC